MQVGLSLVGKAISRESGMVGVIKGSMDNAVKAYSTLEVPEAGTVANTDLFGYLNIIEKRRIIHFAYDKAKWKAEFHSTFGHR